MKKAIIFGITSGIGSGIASLLRKDGWQVYGTSTWLQDEQVKFLDLSDSNSIDLLFDDENFLTDWSLVFFVAGTMKPIGPFFDTNFNEWQESIQINLISQIQILHKLWKYRSKDTVPAVCYLAGGGTNSNFDNYSAYCLSKVSLIKFIELVASENQDANFFIIGPGYVKTKIHNETLEAGDLAGKNFERTLDFLRTDGTSMERLYKHLLWCVSNPICVTSGRNFSTVHDPWDSKFNLVQMLEVNQNLYKLRRRDIDEH